MNLPSELHLRIAAKAEQMCVRPEYAITALLNIGLEAQERREAALTNLIENYRATTDAAEQTRLGDQLGEAIHYLHPTCDFASSKNIRSSPCAVTGSDACAPDLDSARIFQPALCTSRRKPAGEKIQ